MFNYHAFKSQLLKAVSLSKIQSRKGKVLVQRAVNKPGIQTFYQHFWVNPDQVKSTDVVLAGHHNLQSTHPQRPAQVRSLGSSAPVTQAVKDATQDLFQKCNQNPQLFFKVLQHNLGLQWNVHPTSAGINMMRAKMALNNAQMNGLNLATFPPHLLGLNTPGTPQTQPAPAAIPAPQQQAAPQPQQSTQPAPAPQQPAQPNAAGINLPPKAKKASQASKDAATAFANTFANRQDFYDALTKMGITWNTNANPGINLMWAKCALSQHIESGFDPVAAWNTVQQQSQQQSSSPVAAPASQTQQSASQQSQSAPAAQPQQAAPASDSTPQPDPTPAPDPTPSAPTKDESLLEVDANTTEREKALIEHINKMTDYTTIQKCAVMGLVPEDDVAAEYISEELVNRLKQWVEGTNHMNDCPDAVVEAFTKDMAEIGITVASPLKLLRDNFHNAEIITGMLPTTGYKKKIIGEELHNMFSNKLQMDILFEPEKDRILTTGTFLHNLNEAYADYATDEEFPGNEGKTNQGYTGFSSKPYADRYDINKEGIARLLQKIKKDNPNRPDIAAEVDSIVDKYDKAMKICKGNPHLLSTMLHKYSWTNGQGVSYDYQHVGIEDESYFSKYMDPEAAKVTAEGIEAQATAFLTAMKKLGCTPEQIARSVNSYGYNDDFSDYKYWDASGKMVRANLFQDFPPEAQKLGILSSKGVLQYALVKLAEQEGMSDTDAVAKDFFYKESHMKQIRNWVDSVKEYSTLTESDWTEVKSLLKDAFGDFGTSPAKRFIGTNLLMARAFHTSAGDLAIRALENPDNAANDYGNDYSKNYDYYYSSIRHMKKSVYRFTNPGSTMSFQAQYTAQELSDKVTAQLNSVPQLSAEYMDKITKYYTDQLAANGATVTPESLAKIASNDDFNKIKFSAQDLSPLHEKPTKDIFRKMAMSLISHIPKTVEKKNWEAKLDKKWGYTPFDFAAVQVDSAQQKATSAVPDTITPQHLKEARQKLLERAAASIATEDEQTSDAMRKDIIKNRFDYKAGDKSPDGKVFSGPFHTGPKSLENRCVLFNSRFFKLNNSFWKDRFDAEQAKLKAANPNDPDVWTPMELFHGTSRASAANILGRDKAWFINRDFVQSGQALGPGAYFGFVFGKSHVYAGDNSYAGVKRSFLQEGEADGIMIMAQVMRGDNYFKGNSTDPSYSSISYDGFRDWEMVVRDNALICPHHFCDVSCRAFKAGNVSRDANGNFLDTNGNITHDKNAKALNMK